MLLFRKLGELAVRSLVNYYSGAPQLLSTTEGKAKLGAFKLITILARQHYEERHITLPVTEPKDISKILKLKHSKDYDLYEIKKQNDNSSIITLWRFLNKEQLPSCFVIPETKLLENAIAANTVVDVTAETNQYFFAKTDFISKSTLKTPLIANTYTFAKASGLSYSQAIKVDTVTLKELLNEGLNKFTFSRIGNFWWQKQSSNKQAFDFKWFLPATLIAAGYIALSSSYLVYKESTLNNEISELSEESQLLLKKKQKIDTNIETIVTLTTLSNNSAKTTNIWEVLLPLYEYGVKFNSIRVNGDSAYISGTVKQAITVLELLNQNDKVRNAKFNGALFNTDKGERFNVEFHYE